MRIIALEDKAQTGAEMSRVTLSFSSDIKDFALDNVPLDKLPFERYYDFVKHLPYKRDYEGIEIIMRPSHMLKYPTLGYDCKKKAILIASWLHENHMPFHFAAVSTKPDGEFHHVVVQAETPDGPAEIDATYAWNDLGKLQPWTKKELLSGFSKGHFDGKPTIVSIDGIEDEEKKHPETMGIIWFVPILITAVLSLVSFGVNQTWSDYRAQSEKRFAKEMMDLQDVKTGELQKEQNEANKNAWLTAGAVAGTAILFFL